MKILDKIRDVFFDTSHRCDMCEKYSFGGQMVPGEELGEKWDRIVLCEKCMDVINQRKKGEI